MNIAPAARSSQCMPRCTACLRAIHAAASAQPMFTGTLLMLNSARSSRNASVLSPASGAMNCGTKARKKIATFGFSTLVQKPPRKTACRLASGASCASVRRSAAVSGARAMSRRQPTQSRYAAPSHLSAVKAVAEAASSAPTPSAAAHTWTKHPAVMPGPATMPARAPERSDCVTMYSTSGPGVRFSSQPAAMNSNRWCRSGMACSGAEETADRGDRAVDAGLVDVQVRDEPQPVQARRQDAVLLQVLDQRAGAFTRSPGEVDEHDVGLRR